MLDAQAVEAFLQSARTGESRVRRLAIETLTLLPLGADALRALASAAVQCISELPQSHPDYAHAIRICARIPVRSVRVVLGRIAGDLENPASLTCALELARHGDGSGLRRLLAELGAPNAEEAIERLACLPLEQLQVAAEHFTDALSDPKADSARPLPPKDVDFAFLPWDSFAEAKRVRETLNRLASPPHIESIGEYKTADALIEAIKSDRVNFYCFFCHGHTRAPLDADFGELLKRQLEIIKAKEAALGTAAGGGAPDARRIALLQFITSMKALMKSSLTAKDHAIELSDGTVNYQELAARVGMIRLQTQPVFFLDMCQSACGLKPLQILDDRPALVRCETGAIFVPAIAVAVGIHGVGHEGAVLERRLVGHVADVLGIEQTAADHETGLALFCGRQQFPKVRHRAVVEVRRGRPDAAQHARFVSRSGIS
jgi:hypothetical protein